MAAPINSQASTLEGQFAEILHHIQRLEQDPAANPNNIQSITGNWVITQDEFSFQGTFLLRTFGSINDSGQLVLTPSEYLITPNSGV